MELKLVNFEQAKTLKKLGFPQRAITSIGWYSTNGQLSNSSIDVPLDLLEGESTAPTLEFVTKWLREEKGLWIEISKGGYEKSAHCFLNDYIYENETNIKEFDSYEEALSAGIDKAIEILKN